MKALVALAVVAATAGLAHGEPLRVVVRHAGGALAVDRLAGQLSDLDVEVVEDDRALERTVDAQIAAATKLATKEEAKVVVWFRADGKATVVAVATPADRRVFLRTVEAGSASATAEAAAQAVRGALKAIAMGGTIGVEVAQIADAEEVTEPKGVPEPAPVVVAATPPSWRWNGAAGWQVDVDGGASVGAHAIWQRLGVGRGRWGGALGLSLGPPLRKSASGVVVDLSRSSVLGEGELRLGALRASLGAGVAIYHRATVDVPGGLTATDSQVQARFELAPEVRWVAHLGASWGVEITGGLDVVFGAPELVVDQGGGMTDSVAKIATLQPRIALGLVVGR